MLVPDDLLCASGIAIYLSSAAFDKSIVVLFCVCVCVSFQQLPSSRDAQACSLWICAPAKVPMVPFYLVAPPNRVYCQPCTHYLSFPQHPTMFPVVSLCTLPRLPTCTQLFETAHCYFISVISVLISVTTHLDVRFCSRCSAEKRARSYETVLTETQE